MGVGKDSNLCSALTSNLEYLSMTKLYNGTFLSDQLRFYA